ncbi:MAG: phytoene/squalene synthase family protein [Bacteroidetes bacterium]|nr:phytoene/squalene synthase family protein [Bacteroidota bacterium]
MISLFHSLSQSCSKITTEQYSTSFSNAIKLLHKDLRPHIYNIYGFVRVADEIVDSFHEYDKAMLLDEFKQQTRKAIDQKISTNPILHSFQLTVNEYNIDYSLIDAFFVSMEFDLTKKRYDEHGYKDYIYGSAEVVGLMCLYIFCEGDSESYNKLMPYAQSLGAAFQKVNFLRDMKADFTGMNRTYFPGIDFNNFTGEMKKKIEEEISADFNHAYQGICQLPYKARFGVYVAYQYYLSLFFKIRQTQPNSLLSARIRIPNYAKAFIVLRAGLKNQLNIL